MVKKKTAMKNQKNQTKYKEAFETLKSKKSKPIMGSDLFSQVRTELRKKNLLLIEEHLINSKPRIEQYHYVEDLFSELLEVHDWEERNGLIDEVCRELKSLLGIDVHTDFIRSVVIKTLDAERIL